MDLQSFILNNANIENLASQLGLSGEQARAGASALLPAILGGFKSNAQANTSGLGGLLDGLGQLGGTSLAEQVLAPGATDPSLGNTILGQIFGSKDVSRQVASHAAAQSGVSDSLLKKMLPLLAMLVAGYLSSRGGGQAQEESAGGGGLGGMLQGGLGGLLGGLFGGGGQNEGQAANQSGGGPGGLASMLDMDGDGNPLDDILGMAGSLQRS